MSTYIQYFCDLCVTQMVCFLLKGILVYSLSVFTFEDIGKL